MDKYGFVPEVQRDMVRQILSDPAMLPKVALNLNPERFQDERARLILRAALDYFKTYQRIPTVTPVLQGIRSLVEAGGLAADKLAECADYIDAAQDAKPGDSKFLMDLVFREEQASAMYTALDRGLIQYRQKTPEAYQAIEREISLANLIGKVDSSPGIAMSKTLDLRTADRLSGNVPKRYGTGIQDLNDALSGGLAAGELGCILGAAKGGKSTALGHIAVSLAQEGGTVVYITLEMGEQPIVDRQDAAISRTPIALLTKQATQVHNLVDGWFKEKKGEIIVKYMLPRITTCREIRGYLQQLRLKDIIPTVLVVDYGDLLGAVSSSYEKRHEELGVVYTELRALLGDYGIPGWTGSQANKEALSQQVVTAANVAESYKKVGICDVLIALCRTDEEKEANMVRMFIAACRYATDGVLLGPYRSGFNMGRLVLGRGVAVEET